jgi:hypothetical protein
MMRSEAIPHRLFALALVDLTGAALAVALFGIIVANVAGLGLLPPSVVRRVGLANYAAEHKAELAARSPALKVAERRLEQLAAGRAIHLEVRAFLRARHD